MKVVLLNWTGNSAHFGCKLVCEAYDALFNKYCMEVLDRVPLGEDWQGYRHVLDKADLVVVNGEGSLHHDRHQHLINVAGSHPSVLINTVYEGNTPKSALKEFLVVSARETRSAKELESHGRPDAMVTPDIILESPTLSSFMRLQPETGAGTCTTDSVVYSIGTKARLDPLKWLTEVSRFQNVCTGRFHGILACASIGIPFSAYRSNTWKNESLMADMGISHLYGDDYFYARGLVPDSMPDSVGLYVENGRKRIDQLMQKLASL